MRNWKDQYTLKKEKSNLPAIREIQIKMKCLIMLNNNVKIKMKCFIRLVKIKRLLNSNVSECVWEDGAGFWWECEKVDYFEKQFDIICYNFKCAFYYLVLSQKSILAYSPNVFMVIFTATMFIIRWVYHNKSPSTGREEGWCGMEHSLSMEDCAASKINRVDVDTLIWKLSLKLRWSKHQGELWSQFLVFSLIVFLLFKKMCVCT